MNKINLAKIDLNLLVVFNEIWEAGSVTEAANCLGLSQSAVSHALNRLRALMEDPLLVRTGGRLMPTTRAAALAPALREALDLVERALREPTFDPAQTMRNFRIGASEFTSPTLLPTLCPELHQRAPQASFTFQGLTVPSSIDFPTDASTSLSGPPTRRAPLHRPGAIQGDACRRRRILPSPGLWRMPRRDQS